MTTTNSKFVADFTKCYPAAFPSVLDAVLELAKAHGITDSDLIIVGRTDQAFPDAFSATKQVVQGSSFNAWFFALPVLKGILEHLARSVVRSVILASFSSQVLNLNLDPPGGMQITDVFLGALRGERTIPSRVAPPSASGGE